MNDAQGLVISVRSFEVQMNWKVECAVSVEVVGGALVVAAVGGDVVMYWQ